MKDDNSKFPWKYSSQSLESLQVCSSMLSFFSALISLKYTIHNTNQQAIKHLLLKTNNKRNRTIGNSVEKSFGYCNQVLDHYNLFFFLCHTGLGSLNQVFDRLRGKIVLPTNCLCVFDHFAGLALKVFMLSRIEISGDICTKWVNHWLSQCRKDSQI